jgi:hypothetical protein
MKNDLSEAKKNRALAYINTLWQPHAGQIEAGQAIFQTGAKMIYIECGRKFGKSEFSVFLCWMYAILNPNSEVYYLAPAVKLAKELVWSNQRMQTCNSYDRNFLATMGKLLGGKIEVSKQEMRVVLPNGSFIKTDGSDNIDSQLGLKPDLIIADEFRTFKEEWLEFMTPNLAAKNGTLAAISTPPLGPNRAYEHALECKKGMKEGNPRYYYLNLPSSSNDAVPHLSKWLEEEKDRLYALGRENEWLREYMAQYISSNEHAIIPQLSRKTKTLMSTKKIGNITKKAGRYEAFICINPGNSTIAGALLMVLNRSNGDVFILDEFKVYDSQKTSAKEIWPLIDAKFTKTLAKCEISQFIPSENVTLLCPPKTSWFKRDMHEAFDIVIEDADKVCDKPEYNIGLIKDLLISKKLVVNEECPELTKESETYIRHQKNFSIPQDQNKLLIYCLRAILSGMGYTSDLIELETDKDDDEKYLDRVLNAKSFDEKMRDIRLEKYGILHDEDPGIFPEDIEDDLL